MNATPATTDEIRAWLVGQIAAILSLPEDDVDPDETFDSFGLASRDAVSLSGDLEDYLSRRLSPTLLYQYPTINKLAEHLAATGRGAACTKRAQRPGSADRPKPGGTNRDTCRGRLAGRRPGERCLSEDEAEAALLRKLLELGE